jgi:streptogramin lyase
MLHSPKDGTEGEMRGRFFLLAASLAITGSAASARTSGSVALTGTVSSLREGNMEGVLVTAKRDGSTISITVVTDKAGRYSFPASRLGPGRYELKIRAAGYDLASTDTANVTAGKPFTLNLKLQPTENLADQLTNAEWLMSIPGTDAQKRPLGDCTGCHTLHTITGSNYKAKDFERLIPLMGTYFPGSQPGRKQVLLPGPRGNRGISDMAVIVPMAKYLESINLSKSTRYSYPLKTLPRPTGRATRVIITTYDLPRPEAEPHDAVVVAGHVYYSDFGSLYVGELDPVTGKVRDYKIPVLKPAAPKGTLGLQADRAGNVWVALMYQGGLAKLDGKTKKITTYALPSAWQNGSTQQSMLAAEQSHVDGKVWTNDQSDHTFLRLDVATGRYEKIPAQKDQNGQPISGYGLPVDQKNNLYPLEFTGSGTKIGRVDAKTKLLTTWTSPLGRARPRRGQFDNMGVLWFGEFGADAIGSVNPATGKLQEWKLPLKWSMPYDAVKANKTGDVWTGSMLNDRITRFNPVTKQLVHYLLPEETNIRRVFFDDATNSFWVGANHKPTIIKVEALD